MPYGRYRPSMRRKYRSNYATSRKVKNRVAINRARSRALTRKIKAVSLSQAETKVARAFQETIELFHNQTHYIGGMLFTRGSFSNDMGYSEGMYGRLGNEIVGKGIKLKFVFNNAQTRPAVMFKVYVFWYNTSEVLADSLFWNGQNGAGSFMYRPLDSVCSNRVKLIKSFTIQGLRDYAEEGEEERRVAITQRSIWIPLKNRKIKYKFDGPDLGVTKFKDIGIAVYGVDTNNTAALVNVGDFSWSKCLYYKDP